MQTKTLGEYIKELRDRKDLSLREFADKLGGLSAAFLSDVELGRRNPSDEVLKDMAAVLGVSLQELKKYDNRPPVNLLKKNPQYHFAFRQAMEKKIPHDELLKFIEERNKHPKKDQHE